jgi:hypothetical protein
MSTTDYRPQPSVSALFKSETEGERILRIGREMREQAEARGQTLTRSADIHEQRAMRKRAEARAERQLRTLASVAAEREEDEALERATELLSRGGRPGADTRAKALRALERQGGRPKVSSAEQHAEDYLSHSSAGFEFEI